MSTILTITLALAAGGLSGSHDGAESKARAEPKAKVLVLGVYHFDSPNLDLVKSARVDHLSEEKQAEIAVVLDKLAAFAPTRIVLEAPPDATSLQDRYQAFRRDECELSGNEREQLGFQLARQFDHPRVYLADHPSGMDFDAVLGAARAAGDQRFLDWFSDSTKVASALMERLAGLTVRDALVELNRPELQDQTRDLYLQLARASNGSDYAGARVVAEWYRRNFCIFANVTRAIESSDDRVLVLFGQGHVHYLRELVKSSPDLELVETNAFLAD